MRITARYNRTVLQRVAEFITRYSMFPPGARVAVAVSGGADSTCLLYALAELAPRWNLRLSVLHLNHSLRGEESEADAAFVRQLSGRFGFPLLERRWERRPGDSSNLEEAAREARLGFFSEVLAGEEGCSGAERVAVGHTRSDQAETVLFRLLRGAGSAGLAGIRPVTQAGIVRPLLCVERNEVECFLRERGIGWREDSTNRSEAFARNRIRHQLLPLLERENPAIRETLANIADWALAEEEYWRGETARLAAGRLRREGGAVLLEVRGLGDLPVAAVRRLIRCAMERAKGNLRSIDFAHVEAVRRMALAPEGHGRLQAAGLDVFRSFDWVRFAVLRSGPGERPEFSFEAPVPGSLQMPGGGEIHLELIEKTVTSEAVDCVYNEEMGCLDWERAAGPLELRNWRPGDRYEPVGRRGEEKLKTLFQEARIPLWERSSWPLLTKGQVILWARRFGPAAGYAAGPASRKMLTIRETRTPGADS